MLIKLLKMKLSLKNNKNLLYNTVTDYTFLNEEISETSDIIKTNEKYLFYIPITNYDGNIILKLPIRVARNSGGTNISETINTDLDLTDLDALLISYYKSI